VAVVDPVGTIQIENKPFNGFECSRHGIVVHRFANYPDRFVSPKQKDAVEVALAGDHECRQN
jgi:hypothetical protein